jgi:hypothetical protein
MITHCGCLIAIDRRPHACGPTGFRTLATTAPEPAPSASNLPAAKKVGRPHNSLKAPLQKKGNERYGRFE